MAVAALQSAASTPTPPCAADLLLLVMAQAAQSFIAYCLSMLAPSIVLCSHPCAASALLSAVAAVASLAPTLTSAIPALESAPATLASALLTFASVSLTSLSATPTTSPAKVLAASSLAWSLPVVGNTAAASCSRWRLVVAGIHANVLTDGGLRVVSGTRAMKETNVRSRARVEILINPKSGRHKYYGQTSRSGVSNQRPKQKPPFAPHAALLNDRPNRIFSK